jgi:RHS repeat-associated protein
MGDVTAVMMDVITEKSGHVVTPMAVSVCLTPAAPAPLPTPYPVIGSSSDGIIDPPMRTKINGAAIGTVGSCIKDCHGNEPGTLKEVVSLNTTGPCFIIMGAPIVLCELGMMGITGSPCISNKAITAGAPANASDASGTGGPGGGGGGGGGSGGDASGTQGPSGGGGSGGSDTNSGAAGPGASSGAAAEHQCQNGHPVDLVTGNVVDVAIDLELPGFIPFVWKRSYSSARRTDDTATLGPGWAHPFEQRITEGEAVITLREAEGREVYFAKIKSGESTFHRKERMTLHRDAEDRFRVEQHDALRTLDFASVAQGGPFLLRAVRDGHDNALTLHYDGARLTHVMDSVGREIRVVVRRGRVTRLEVRAEGMLAQWVDYEYGPTGCLTRIVDALGHFDELEYDRHKRMVAATIKTGLRFQYEYEENTGRCKKTWGPKGLYAIELETDLAQKLTFVHGEEPKVIAWNDLGLATRESLPDGTVIEEAAYDEDGNLIARTNGAGEGIQLWYDARGNRIREVDANGNVYAWEYDAHDMPARQIDPAGLVTEFTHDAHDALIGVRYPSGLTYSITRDRRGRATEVLESGVVTSRLEYDGAGNVIAETNARGARTTYAYDALGRPVSRKDSLGRVTYVTYDRLGRILSLRLPDGGVVQQAFDPRGRLVRQVDPIGRTTAMEWGGMGVLTRLTQPDGRAWSFAYTSQERLREVKNPRGEAYSFAHDGIGRLVEERTFDGRALAYARGPGGRVERVDYPDKTWRAFGYDRLGNPLRDEASDGSAVTFRRDQRGRVLAAELEEDGHRIETALERDFLGRVTAERQGDRAVRYGYDVRGSRVERIMPDGQKTRYAYDGEGRLSAVDHEGYELTITRDDGGRDVQRAGPGGVAINSSYDAVDRLIEQRAVAPSPEAGLPSVLVQRQWQHDRDGRVTRVDDARWGTTRYVYDRADQLLSALTGNHAEVFRYDPGGALVSALEGLDARGADWKTAPGNRLEQTATAKYTYDKRGRRTVKLALDGAGSGGGGDVTTYRWDARDRLREVTLPDGRRVEMTYDAFGRRLRKEVHAADAAESHARPETTEFVWEGDAIAADLRGGRGARTFVRSPNGSLEVLLQAERGEVYLYVNDPLGMPMELVDARGRLAWSARHSVWGQVLSTQTDALAERTGARAVDTPFRHLGQYADEETGLTAARYRYFDPEVGRWLSPDPIGLRGGRDMYGFDGCPTIHVDPLGLSTTTGAAHPVDQAAAAASWQGKGDYPGVDQWQNGTLKKGTIVYGGLDKDGNPSGFFIPQEALDASGGSKKALWEGLQVKENPKYGYRDHLGAFMVTEDTPAAFGDQTLANPQFGKGGLGQIYTTNYGPGSNLQRVPGPGGTVPLH